MSDLTESVMHLSSPNTAGFPIWSAALEVLWAKVSNGCTLMSHVTHTLMPLQTLFVGEGQVTYFALKRLHIQMLAVYVTKASSPVPKLFPTAFAKELFL